LVSKLKQVIGVSEESREDIDQFLKDLITDNKAIEPSSRWAAPWRPSNPKKVFAMAQGITRLSSPALPDTFLEPAVIHAARWNLQARHEAIAIAASEDQITRVDWLPIRRDMAYTDVLGHHGLEIAHGYYSVLKNLYRFRRDPLPGDVIDEVSNICHLRLGDDEITLLEEHLREPAADVYTLAGRFSELHHRFRPENRGIVVRLFFPWLSRKICTGLFVGTVFSKTNAQYQAAVNSDYPEVWQPYWIEALTLAADFNLRLFDNVNQALGRLNIAVAEKRESKHLRSICGALIMEGGCSAKTLLDLTGISNPGFGYIIEGLTLGAFCREVSGRHIYRFFEVNMLNDV